MLVSRHVPFDLAFSLTPDEVLAWTIVLGEFEGGLWDWEKLCWRDPNSVAQRG